MGFRAKGAVKGKIKNQAVTKAVSRVKTPSGSSIGSANKKKVALGAGERAARAAGTKRSVDCKRKLVAGSFGEL